MTRFGPEVAKVDVEKEKAQVEATQTKAEAAQPSSQSPNPGFEQLQRKKGKTSPRNHLGRIPNTFKIQNNSPTPQQLGERCADNLVSLVRTTAATASRRFYHSSPAKTSPTAKGLTKKERRNMVAKVWCEKRKKAGNVEGQEGGIDDIVEGAHLKYVLLRRGERRKYLALYWEKGKTSPRNDLVLAKPAKKAKKSVGFDLARNEVHEVEYWFDRRIHKHREIRFGWGITTTIEASRRIEPDGHNQLHFPQK
ncbi:hypothetical protein MMC07_004881 [Pseudocyphellaria aurata]|nr:hypothetical protein [Pseudocyphellaria aurata]